MQSKKTEYLREAMEYVRKNELSSYVGFYPYSHDLAKEWETAHIVASTCVAEGFGLSVLEGMASGCLAVGPDAGGVYDLVKDGNGVAYRFGDDEDLARKLVKAFHMVREDDETIRHGAEHARKMTVERQVDLIENNLAMLRSKSGQ